MAEANREAAWTPPTADDAPPPSKLLLLLEGRAMGELATSIAIWSWLRRQCPEGDGHGVLVLPGFAASDFSTRPLRRFLRQLGYRAHRWKQGRNLGHSEELVESMLERLDRVHREHDRRTVSLIGWSLGGVYARTLAQRRPEAIRCVITLGSPFTNNPKANNSWRLYQVITGRRIEDIDPELISEVRRTPPVPTTSIYSRSDGVAAWQSSLEMSGDRSENIRVPGSHLGLGFNPLVLYAIADRLAQDPASWHPFERTGWRETFYPEPDHRTA